MNLREELRAERVEGAEARQRALDVLRATYREEKGWVNDEDLQLPADDLSHPGISWFLVCYRDQPIGVLRVLYDPPLHLYKQYGLKFTRDLGDIDAFLRTNRIAEVGRFAVLSEYRRHIVVVAALMREAITETVARGYTHYITDVFQDEEHSPFQFHTNVLGFEPIATHDVGELNCDRPRITMILDFNAAYLRMSRRRGWVFRFLTGHWDEALHRRLSLQQGG